MCRVMKNTSTRGGELETLSMERWKARGESSLQGNWSCAEGEEETRLERQGGPVMEGFESQTI